MRVRLSHSQHFQPTGRTSSNPPTAHVTRAFSGLIGLSPARGHDPVRPSCPAPRSHLAPSRPLVHCAEPPRKAATSSPTCRHLISASSFSGRERAGGGGGGRRGRSPYTAVTRGAGNEVATHADIIQR